MLLSFLQQASAGASGSGQSLVNETLASLISTAAAPFACQSSVNETQASSASTAAAPAAHSSKKQVQDDSDTSSSSSSDDSDEEDDVVKESSENVKAKEVKPKGPAKGGVNKAKATGQKKVSVKQ